METLSVSTASLVKYIIIGGLIYCILKSVPAQKIPTKDLLLVLMVIVVSFVLIDCVAPKTTEKFTELPDASSTNSLSNLATSITTGVSNIVSSTAVSGTTSSVDASSTLTNTGATSTGATSTGTTSTGATSTGTTSTGATSTGATSTGATSTEGDIDRIRRDLQEEIQQLKAKLEDKTKLESNNRIINNYFESLLSELLDKGIIDTKDANNIKVKVNSRLLSLEEAVKALETLRTEGKAKDKKAKTDMEYTELLPDFYTPIGEKISNDWGNDYAILDTNRWRVPMPRPPVCINNTPCQVCPSQSSNYPVTLKEWDNSRKVTDIKLNRRWAENNSS